MECNTGKIDRAIRLLAGIGLLGLYGALAAPWRNLTLVGLILVTTAVTGFCPVYRLLGLCTHGPGSGKHDFPGAAR